MEGFQLLVLVAPLAAQLPVPDAYWEVEVREPVAEPDGIQPHGLLQEVMVAWIAIYQTVIASQDLPSCVFHPSCSQFAVNVIQENGALRGLLLSGDRLMRCNSFVSPYYPFDGEKFVDPVARYRRR